MRLLAAVSISLFACAACAQTASEARAPGRPEGLARRGRPPIAADDSEAKLVVAPEIRQACGLERGRVFPYDSADLRVREAASWSALRAVSRTVRSRAAA